MKTIRILIVCIAAVTLLCACGQPEQPTLPTEAIAPTQQEANQPTQAVPDQATVQPEPTAVTPVDPQPAAFDGMAFLEQRCTTCHTVQKVTGITGTYEEWDVIVTRMITKGANLTAEEKTTLVQYLADNFKGN